VKNYPNAVWVAYVVCVVPAAVGVRSVALGPEGGVVLTTITLGLSAIAGVVLVARLVPSATQKRPSPATHAARIALLGLAVTLLALAARRATPLAEAGLPAFPVALLVASEWLRRSRRSGLPQARPGRRADGVTLEQIAPGMAHAMRKPLAIVSEHLRSLGYTASGPEPTHKLQESVQLVEQLQHLVDSVLDLARGQSAPKLRGLPLQHVLDQAVRDIRARFPAAEIEVGPSGGSLMADEVSLRCLLVNLMENALEVPDAPQWVRVDVEHQGQWVQIEVEDRSGGLPPEVRSHLFEPFVTAKIGGIGLGLATVRQVSLAHGGSVVALDTPEGTRFVVRLPAQAP
jgi:signal transduction histidine kinase